MGDIGVLIGFMGGGVPGLTDFVSVTVQDRWIIRAKNPDGVQLFRQQVSTDIQVTALVTGVAGATTLGLFTWYSAGSDQFTTHYGLDDLPQPTGTYAHGYIDEYEGVACNGQCDQFTQRFWEHKFGADFDNDWWRSDSLTTQIENRPAGSEWVPYHSGLVPQPWDMLVLRHLSLGWYHSAIVHSAGPDGIEIAHSNEDSDGKGKFSYTTGYEIVGLLRWTEAIPHEMARTTLAADCTASSDVLQVADASQLPETGTVYIGIAQDDWWRGTPDRVDYTGRDLTTVPHQLTGCTHGRLGTIARANAAGTLVIEAPALKTGSDESYCVPAGGSDYTDQFGRILFDWYSPIYDLSIPSGAYIEFAGHGIGPADLPFNLDIVSTRVCAGPVWGAIYIPETGYWWVADANGSSGIDVRVGHDVRALGASAQAATADPTGARDWPTTAAEITRAQAWTEVVGSGSNGMPIWVRHARSLYPALVWTSSDKGYVRRFGAFETMEEPEVQITNKPVVAAAYSPDGNLVCICSQRGRATVVTAGLSPYAPADFVFGDLPEFSPPPEIEPVYWDDGEPKSFPAISETIHCLQIPRPGHLKLFTADGDYYESSDGGYNWR